MSSICSLRVSPAAAIAPANDGGGCTESIHFDAIDLTLNDSAGEAASRALEHVHCSLAPKVLRGGRGVWFFIWNIDEYCGPWALATSSAAATLVHVAPLLLTLMPLEELVRKLFGILF